MTFTGNQTRISPPTDPIGTVTPRFGDVFTAMGRPPVLDPGLENTYLEPDAVFPLDLSGMPTLELHILNSRICRQRDREYLTLEGPHSQNDERFYQLQAELDQRQPRRWGRP